MLSRLSPRIVARLSPRIVARLSPRIYLGHTPLAVFSAPSVDTTQQWVCWRGCLRGFLTRLSPRVWGAVSAQRCPPHRPSARTGMHRTTARDYFCAVISAGLNGVADEEEVQGMLHYSESSGRSAVCSAPAPVSPRPQPTQQLHRHRLRRPAAGTSAPVRGVPYKRGGGGLVVAVASAEKNMGRQGWAEAASVVGA